MFDYLSFQASSGRRIKGMINLITLGLSDLLPENESKLKGRDRPNLEL